MEVLIDYTNWKGVRSLRRVLPLEMYYGQVEFHPGVQWLLRATDLDKNEERTFAMRDVHSWTPVANRERGVGC